MGLLAPADPQWPDHARVELSYWKAVLCHHLNSGHHIGSTSVPDLAAKPIIDLLPVVTSLAAVDALTSDIEYLGYEAMGEFGLAGRRYFRKSAPDGTRLFHTHVYALGDPSIERHLAFRDLLRTNPDIRKQYETLKTEADEAAQGNIGRYIQLKNDFIKFHEARALNQVR